MLTPHEIRRVCVLAMCSPPTVRRYLAGERTLPSVRARIEAAIRELGLTAEAR